ncbi:unnamed protein product [Penicillium glandicola]
MSHDSPLLLYFPQWQGSGDEDLIFRGSETLKGFLASDLGVNLTTIGAPPHIKTEDEQASQKANSDWIRNYSILSLYHRHAANTITANSPKKIFTLGGDCGIELAPIRYLNSIYGGDLAVVWLDAHADLNTPSTSPSKTYHGMILRALLETFEVTDQVPGELVVNPVPDFVTSTVTSPLLPKQVFLAGVRDLDPAEKEYIARQDIAVVKCEELEHHQGNVLVDMLRKGGFSKVYIHVDADVLSLGDFDSVMCPTPGGIRTRTLKEVIKDIKQADGIEVVGGSLVEVTNTNDDKVPYRDMATIFASLWLELLSPKPIR